jgi:hypothetical protein
MFGACRESITRDALGQGGEPSPFAGRPNRAALLSADERLNAIIEFKSATTTDRHP